LRTPAHREVYARPFADDSGYLTDDALFSAEEPT
jgi:hypothetical protein